MNDFKKKIKVFAGFLKRAISGEKWAKENNPEFIKTVRRKTFSLFFFLDNGGL